MDEERQIGYITDYKIQMNQLVDEDGKPRKRNVPIVITEEGDEEWISFKKRSIDGADARGALVQTKTVDENLIVVFIGEDGAPAILHSGLSSKTIYTLKQVNSFSLESEVNIKSTNVKAILNGIGCLSSKFSNENARLEAISSMPNRNLDPGDVFRTGCTIFQYPSSESLDIPGNIKPWLG